MLKSLAMFHMLH